MKIVVIGGTGLIGSRLVKKLAQDGHEAAGDVASALAGIVTSSPVNRTIEIGGPGTFPPDELARWALRAFGDPRTVITDAHACYYGVQVSERALVPNDDARLGATRFDA